MMTKIIALAGKKGYGKTTVAKMIEQVVGKHDVITISFADPIRAHLKALFPMLTDEHFKSRELKVKKIPELGNMSPRDLMIFFGQGMRTVNQNVWVDLMETRINQLKSPTNPFRKKFKYILIDDLRMENEMEMLVGLGAHVIHLQRQEPEKTFLEKLKAKFDIKDATEIGVRHLYDSNIDYLLNTDVPIQTTFQQVVEMHKQQFDPQFEL